MTNHLTAYTGLCAEMARDAAQRARAAATELALRAAVDGLGVAYTIEWLAEPFLRSGQLARILEEWSISFQGLYLYYPGHRQVPAALRCLIDMIRAGPRAKPTPGPRESTFEAVG